MIFKSLKGNNQMSENALIPLNEINQGIQVFDDKTFDLVAAASQSFLPRLQLGGGNSEAVKEGKVPMGHYFIAESSAVTPLAASVDVLVIAWQPKAVRIIGDDVNSYTDFNSNEFKKIMAESDVPDSGCMWGMEFLVYSPLVSKFLSFFMCSKSARRVAPEVKALLGRAATLKAKLVKSTKYSWHVPVVTPCSTPFDIPKVEDIKVAAAKFQQQPESTTETVEQTQERAR